MIIADEPPFLFVHIPKTGGMSIVEALPEGSISHGYCHPTTKHQTAPDFIAMHGAAVFQSYFSFAVVRHPLDRFLSRYAFTSTRQAPGAPDEHLFRSIEDFISAIERSDPLLMARPERWRPQYEFIMSDNALLVDRVLRFEALEAEFADVCREIDLPPRPLPRRNVSRRGPMTYTKRVSDFVASYYRRDFEVFGYGTRLDP